MTVMVEYFSSTQAISDNPSRQPQENFFCEPLIFATEPSCTIVRRKSCAKTSPEYSALLRMGFHAFFSLPKG